MPKIALVLLAALFAAASCGQDWQYLNQTKDKGAELAKKGDFQGAHSAYCEAASGARLAQNFVVLGMALEGLGDVHSNTAYKQAQPQMVPQLYDRASKAFANASYGEMEIAVLTKLVDCLRARNIAPDETRLRDAVFALAISYDRWTGSQLGALDKVESHNLAPLLDAWAAVPRALKGGKVSVAVELALAVIAKLEKDKLVRSAAQARLWLATELAKPANAGKANVGVLKLARDAAKVFNDQGCWRQEFGALCLAAAAESDTARASEAASQAWELARRVQETDTLRAIELLVLLSRVAPAAQRDAWKAELTSALVRLCENLQGILQGNLQRGAANLSPWEEWAGVIAGYSGLSARLRRDLLAINKLLSRVRQLEVPPTVAQQTEFAKAAAKAKGDPKALASLAIMAELGNRYEVIALFLENLASDKPLDECAMAVETLVRPENLNVLAELVKSPRRLVAVCAAATILRLVDEGAAFDVAPLLAFEKLDALARVWLLAAQACRGDESAVKALRGLASAPGETADSKEISNTSLLVLAAIGDVSSALEIRKRLPPESNADFYGRNIARLPLFKVESLLRTTGNTSATARARWTHRTWRALGNQKPPYEGRMLLYILPRDRRDWCSRDGRVVEEIELKREEAEFSEDEAEAALFDWAIKRAMRDFPEDFADHDYQPPLEESQGAVGAGGEAELNRPRSESAPSASACWLRHEGSDDSITLALLKKLSECTITNNILHLEISDFHRRCSMHYPENDKDARIRRFAAELDKLYDSAELQIPGHAPVKLKITFKGYAWRDEDAASKGVIKPGTLTETANPERWKNAEYDGRVMFDGELPRDEIGDPLPLELLATAELVVKTKMFEERGEMRFRLSPLRESMVEKPDLAISGFHLEPADPKPGQVLVARLTATNHGRSVTKAGLCTVRFYVRNPQFEEGFRVLAEQQFDPVGWRHGETKTFLMLPVLCEDHFLNAYSHTFVPEDGDVELKVMVDSFNQCEESDEENNITGRTLNWRLGEKAGTRRAEAELLAAMEPMLQTLRAATTYEACMAAWKSLEALFDSARVHTKEIRAALDMVRRVGCGLAFDLEMAAAKKELVDAARSGNLTPELLRRVGGRLSTAQTAFVVSGAPIVMTDLDLARRTTLALSRSAKLTNEGFELARAMGATPEGMELPKGSEQLAEFLSKTDDVVSLARWVDDLRRRGQGDATVKPNTKDATDAVTSLTGLDTILHVPKTVFKNFIDYGDRAFNNCSRVMELISKRLDGQATDQEIQDAIAELKAGMAPAQLGRDIIKDLGVDSMKKVPVLGPVVDFIVSWFEEDERYAQPR